MAGSAFISTSRLRGTRVRSFTITWTADASGDNTVTLPTGDDGDVDGTIVGALIALDTGTSGYDIQVSDEYDRDLLNAGGTNITADTELNPADLADKPFAGGPLTLLVADGGNAGSASVTLFVR